MSSHCRADIVSSFTNQSPIHDDPGSQGNETHQTIIKTGNNYGGKDGAKTIIRRRIMTERDKDNGTREENNLYQIKQKVGGMKTRGENRREQTDRTHTGPNPTQQLQGHVHQDRGNVFRGRN